MGLSLARLTGSIVSKRTRMAAAAFKGMKMAMRCDRRPIRSCQSVIMAALIFLGPDLCPWQIPSLPCRLWRRDQ